MSSPYWRRSLARVIREGDTNAIYAEVGSNDALYLVAVKVGEAEEDREEFTTKERIEASLRGSGTTAADYEVLLTATDADRIADLHAFAVSEACG